MKQGKRKINIAIIIVGAFGLFLLIVFINHRIQTTRESELLLPLGDLVEVHSRMKKKLYTELFSIVGQQQPR